MPRDPHRPMIGDLPSQEVGLIRRDEIILPEEIGYRRRRGQSLAALRLLWEHRRLLFKVTAVGFIASLLIALLIPARYQSTTQLMPPDQSGNMGALAALLSSKGGEGMAGLTEDLFGLKTSGDLFVGVLGSRTVQDDLIRKFDLRRVYGTRSWEAARKILAKRTDVTSNRKSGIITIQVTDRSPRRAAALAQEYTAELDNVVTNLNTSSAHRERVFLEGRLAEVKKDLESAEKAFSDFASKNTAVNIPDQTRAMIGAAADLEGKLMAAQSEVESLKQVYTDSNVRVRQSQARVDELRRQLGKIGGKPGGESAPNGGDLESTYPAIRQLPVLGVTYADLYRGTKVEEAVFESLTQQYELAKVEEAKETPSVKVLDPAEIPEKRSFPPRLLIMTLGAALAFAVGVAFVFGRAEWKSIASDDPGKAFAQEVLATVKASLPGLSSNGSGDGSNTASRKENKPSGAADA